MVSLMAIKLHFLSHSPQSVLLMDTVLSLIGHYLFSSTVVTTEVHHGKSKHSVSIFTVSRHLCLCYFVSLCSL